MQQVKNNKEETPFHFYLEQYPTLDPEQTARRTGVNFDGSAFCVTLMHVPYRLEFPQYRITSAQTDAPALSKLTAQTFLLRYLLEGKDLPFAGTWKTFRQMPWGEVYNQPFTGRCINRSAFTFGSRLEAFGRACEALGGTKTGTGDAGYELPFLQDYRIRIAVWQADEEFGPSAQILFSDNFAAGFTAEDRVVATELLIGELARRCR